MTLEIVRKYTLEPAGPLSAIAADALRAVRLGEADAAAREIYRRTAGWLREKDRWLLCDCRDGAVIAFRLHGSGAVSAVNLPEADVPHAPGCPFGLREAGEDPDVLVGDLFLPDGEPGKPGEGPGDGVERPWTGGRPTGLAQVLKTLMQAAGLNRFDGADDPAAPEDWLEALRRVAGEMRVAGRVTMSDILFTDPAKWAVEGTPERLDETARAWPGRGRPFALLSWLAHDVATHGINRNHPEAGRVEVRSRVPRPIVGRSRIDGAFLFLGLVARGMDGGGWACRAAAVQPILSATIPMPVDSGYERRALDKLRGAAAGLARDAALAGALGGPARVALEKPLFPFVVRGGPCLPDALLTVTRPGGRGRVSAGPDGSLPEGPFEDRDTARYVIEVMGFADDAYERRKENTHARMRRIGRVIRMEGKQFDSSWNGLDTQTRRIARRIGKDVVGRWKQA
ncbi:MAG: hypothetical protein OYH76_14385 [Defluviicoccus sp.]|nr:hypothetical protein [Defluviicoccus sp.]MDE0277079.1 hypothetical protein [Defluviicoccus sp.]